MEVGCQCQARLLYPWEGDPVPNVQEAEFTPVPVWTGAVKFRRPPEFDLRIFHPGASRYTD
jgi:hypothetical protein